MGDRFAEVGGVLRGVCDDVTLFKSGRVNLFNKHKIACVEIGGLHGVGKDDKRLISENVAVGAVEGGDRDDGENHHKHRKYHHKPHQYVLYNIQSLFHLILSLKNIFKIKIQAVYEKDFCGLFLV